MSLIKFLSHSYTKFLFKTWWCLMGLFFVLRSVFFFANHDPNFHTPLYSQGFFVGFRFDNVIICYCLFIPFILLVIDSFLKNKTFLSRITFYIIIAEVFIAELIIVANIPYFHQFGSVISKNAFLWGNSPGMMVGLIFSDFGYWGYLFLFAAIYFVSVYLINGYHNQLRADYNDFPQQKTGFKILAFLCIGTYLVFGARGTTSHKTTIHQGFATVSDNNFINSLGLNPCFVFFQSYASEKESVYKTPADIKKYFAEVRRSLNMSGDDLSLSRESIVTDPPNKFNVIVVLMESMSLQKMGFLGGKVLTPSLNKLIQESVFFDHFYSSGIHTFNGIFSTQTGFPSIFTDHGLTNYTQRPFNGIGTTLKKNGYTNYFFSTHDPNFDNMAGFLKLNGYTNIIGEFDFPSSEALSTLGVPDHILFKHIIERINKDQSSSPFHVMALTASDHGPWMIPSNIPFKPDATTEEQRATQYADWSIGEFMKEAKKQSWYNNTVFMFLGDHGYYVNNTYQMPLSYNNIPLIIHCPALLKPDTISNLGTQYDIFATIMDLIKINYVNESFGMDILHEKHTYVYFSADDKYAVMSENGFYYFNLMDVKEKHLRNGFKIEEKDYYDEKKSFADSLDVKGWSLVQTADYLIHQNYYNK